MRAWVYNGQLELIANYAQRQPRPDEALIRVLLAGICSTDLEILRGYMGFKGVPGHEFVGVVEQSQDSAWIGQRVVGEINCCCGNCLTCLRGDTSHCPQRSTLGISGRDGTMADYCVLPVRNLHLVPDGVADEHAVLIELLAAALEIPDRVHIRPTDQVIVVGDGRLGLLVAQVIRLCGCHLRVVGHHADRLALLKNWQIDTHLEADLPASIQADIVVDCTGHPDGFALARRLTRPRGRLILKSTFYGDNQVNLSALVVDEISVIGSRCGPFAPALRLLEQKLVDVAPLIDSIYSFDQGQAAFERAAAPGALKVLLRP